MTLCSVCGNQIRPGAKFCSVCGASLASGANAPGRLVAGQVLNKRYKIVRPLSKGGMGAIYLVEDADAFGRQRVLKEMLDYVDPADYADQLTYQQAVQHAHQRFEEEARTLAGLKHRGIPDIMAYFSDGSRNYIVMEYVEGTDLERRLSHDDDQGRRVAGQPYPPDDVIRYGIQVCRVLEYLAGLPRPVVHQDIKPANVIVDQAGEVRLVDFGTAKARLAVQPGGKVGLQKSSVYGTVGYAPPEQYQGQSEPRSDVYALVATLYHLATDDDPRLHPFSFPRLPALAQGLWAALDAGLQQDVSRRPTATQLRGQLEALVAPANAAEPIHLRGGAMARGVAELVQICDRYWEDGKYHLYRGDFEERLRKWGRTDLEAKTAAIRKQQANQDLGLDAFLRLLDPAYPLPRLQASPPVLDLGSVAWGEQRTVQVDAQNVGHGCLQGRVVAQAPWLIVGVAEFIAHERQALRAAVDTSRMTPHDGQAQVGRVLIDAGMGGQAQVEIRVVVPEPRVVVIPAALNLGIAFQGETRTGRLAVSNQGSSPCEVTVASGAAWAKATPDRFRCAPGQSVAVNIAADTNRMGLGTHKAGMVVTAAVGGWRQEMPVGVAIDLPWLRTFVRRYWVPLVALGVVAMILLVLGGVQLQKLTAYNRGHSLRAAGQWEQAVVTFAQLGNYRDAPTQILETHYQAGLAYMGEKRWEEAVAAFAQIGDYRDAPTQILETHYQAGMNYLIARHWEEAATAFAQAGDYRNAPSLFHGTYEKIGTVLSPQDGMEQVLVPAGEFLMGSADGDRAARAYEMPQHTVYLDTYWIDMTEVTNDQYRKCEQAGQCAQPDGTRYGDVAKADHPVVPVSWEDAKAYCAWAGRRLPTEAEWEKAARGPDGRTYPWGEEEPTCGRANYNACGGDTSPVASYPTGASPYGALDMAGNVWEWVADWFDPNYYASAPARNPPGPAAGQDRVLRGGSWAYAPDFVRAASRYGYTPGPRNGYIGFRCARSP